MKLCIRYDIFIGLDSIHDKLSSDQSLNMFLVSFFTLLMVNHLLSTDPYETSTF